MTADVPFDFPYEEVLGGDAMSAHDETGTKA